MLLNSSLNGVTDMVKRATLFALTIWVMASPALATSICQDGYGLFFNCGGSVISNPPSQPPSQRIFIGGREFRSFSGNGNNLDNPLLGQAGTSFIRNSGTAYSDGISSPARVNGPNVRDVSNAVMSDSGAGGNRRNLSNMFWAWGQFIDHDLTFTEGAGTRTITTRANDPRFGGRTLTLDGSASAAGTGAGTGRAAEQINTISAFLDGSAVYGSSQAQADSLRSFQGGRMRESDFGMLPMDSNLNYQAGDVRVNEQQQLIGMHTLMVREHNRIADILAETNPTWTDEMIYQTARSVVGAQIQAVTYNEWLPQLLGDNGIGAYTGYNANVNPQITSEFSTCAFRFCHSMIPDELERLAENGDPIAQGHVQLRDSFFRPDMIRNDGGIEPILRGLASAAAREVDANISDAVRNFLIEGGEEGDLAARNLFRGREHGLPDYNTLRAAYGLPPIRSWAELTDDPVLQAQLQSLYGDISNLDPFLGAMLEEHFAGGIVGALNSQIIRDQFMRLRDGDRFWYERIFGDVANNLAWFGQDALDRLFGGDVLAWLRNNSLSDIITRNTDIAWLQDDVFIAQNRAAALGRASAPGGLALLVLGLAMMRRRRAPLA